MRVVVVALVVSGWACQAGSGSVDATGAVGDEDAASAPIDAALDAPTDAPTDAAIDAPPPACLQGPQPPGPPPFPPPTYSCPPGVTICTTPGGTCHCSTPGGVCGPPWDPP